MLRNNNLKICFKLVRRDFQFHKGQNALLAFAIMLVCTLCTFAFSLGGMVYDGYSYQYQQAYGSTSHILYYGMSGRQADALSDHAMVKDTVCLTAIGVLSDEMMEYRSVKLAAANDQWAKATEAVPLYGRMPLTEDEIALDEMTMNSLAVPHELGTEVTIRWRPVDKGEERTDTFRLCGWWDSAMNYTETCAWITEEKAQSLCGSMPDVVTLGVTLHQPNDLEMQAAEILNDLGLKTVDFTVNLAYNDARKRYAREEAQPYYLMNLVVILCGILMISNIVRISIEQNIQFFGRMKSLGMTPRQIRYFLLERVSVLCLAAIPLGWLFGVLLYLFFAPRIVIGMEDKNPALFFFRFRPLAVSALVTWLTTLLSVFWPTRIVTGSTPAQAVRYIDEKMPKQPSARRSARRRTSILAMAVAGLRRNSGHILLAAVSLFIALTLMCSVWTQYVSYDQEKYIAGLAVTDYSIVDASATMAFQRYNPKSHSITPQMAERIADHPAVTEMGVIRTMEVPMTASEEERAPIVESFEYADENGEPRKAAMAGYPDWMAGYEKMKESGAYIGIVTGVDGLAAKLALTVDESIDGKVDLELFETGRYVIAAGASATGFISTPPAGSHVTIGGKEFEIMASVPAPSVLVSGANSREAAFNVMYYVPEWLFDEMFPDSGIRDVVINIDPGQRQEFEVFLKDVLKDSYACLTTYSDYQRNFESARFRIQLLFMMLGIVLLIIGILNLGNALVTKMLARKKEFAVYESLGMTHRQLQKLMLTEGLLYGAMLAVLLIPTVAAATWGYTRWWVNHTDTWCITYHYSLLLLWLSMPVLFLLAVMLPLGCLRFLTRESVTQRLRIVD